MGSGLGIGIKRGDSGFVFGNGDLGLGIGIGGLDWYIEAYRRFFRLKHEVKVLTFFS